MPQALGGGLKRSISKSTMGRAAYEAAKPRRPAWRLITQTQRARVFGELGVRARGWDNSLFYVKISIVNRTAFELASKVIRSRLVNTPC